LPPQAERASRAALLVWIAAFLLHRGAVLAFGFDGVFFWEEAYRLVVSEALRGGWAIPLHDLQADPYAGGSLVLSMLAAAATPLAGSSLTALKGVALAWNALGLGLWLVAVDRAFGRRAAHLLGFVWLAAPPVFVVFNVVAMGFHGDAVTLTGLQLLLLLRWLDEPSRRGPLFAFAAAGGFGVWFAYSSAIPLAVMVAYAMVAGALVPSRWLVAGAGFVAGFSPWIAYNLAAGGSLAIVGQTFAGSGERGYAERLADLVAHGVPAALYFRDIGIPGDVKMRREVLAYAYLALYAVAFVSLAVAAARGTAASASSAASRTRGAAGPLAARFASRPELAVLPVFPLFLAVIAASNHEFNDLGVVRWFTFRVLVPAVPSLFLAIALFAARSGPVVRAAALAICLVTAVVGSGQLLGAGSGSRELREPEALAIGAEAMGHLLVFKHGVDPELFRARIDALPEDLRAPAWRGVGENTVLLFTRGLATRPAAELTSALVACDPGYRAQCIEGARLATGPGTFQVAAMPPSPRRDELVAAIEAAE
jgi:hypothetical protein